MTPRLFTTETVPKKYYSMGEVSRKVGFSDSSIRFYETKFGKLHTKVKRNGARLFTTRDLHKLRFIHYLLRKEMYSIPGAIQQFKLKFK